MLAPVKANDPSRAMEGSDVDWLSLPFAFVSLFVDVFGLSGLLGTSVVGHAPSSVPTMLTWLAQLVIGVTLEPPPVFVARPQLCVEPVKTPITFAHSKAGALNGPAPELVAVAQVALAAVPVRTPTTLPQASTGAPAPAAPLPAVPEFVVLPQVADDDGLITLIELPQACTGAVTPDCDELALPLLLAEPHVAFVLPLCAPAALPQICTGAATPIGPVPGVAVLVAVPQLPLARARTPTPLPQTVIGAVIWTPFVPGVIDPPPFG